MCVDIYHVIAYGWGKERWLEPIYRCVSLISFSFLFFFFFCKVFSSRLFQNFPWKISTVTCSAEDIAFEIWRKFFKKLRALVRNNFFIILSDQKFLSSLTRKTLLFNHNSVTWRVSFDLCSNKKLKHFKSLLNFNSIDTITYYRHKNENIGIYSNKWEQSAGRVNQIFQYYLNDRHKIYFKATNEISRKLNLEKHVLTRLQLTRLNSSTTSDKD